MIGILASPSPLLFPSLRALHWLLHVRWILPLRPLQTPWPWALWRWIWVALRRARPSPSNGAASQCSSSACLLGRSRAIMCAYSRTCTHYWVKWWRMMGSAPASIPGSSRSGKKGDGDGDGQWSWLCIPEGGAFQQASGHCSTCACLCGRNECLLIALCTRQNAGIHERGMPRSRHALELQPTPCAGAMLIFSVSFSQF